MRTWLLLLLLTAAAFAEGGTQPSFDRFCDRWPGIANAMRRMRIAVLSRVQFVPARMLDPGELDAAVREFVELAERIRPPRGPAIERLQRSFERILFHPPRVSRVRAGPKTWKFVGTPGLVGESESESVCQDRSTVRETTRIAFRDRDGRVEHLRRTILEAPGFSLFFSEGDGVVGIHPPGKWGVATQALVLLRPMPFGAASSGQLRDHFVARGRFVASAQRPKLIECNAIGLPVRWGTGGPIAARDPRLRGPSDPDFESLNLSVWANWDGLLFPSLLIHIEAMPMESEVTLSVEIVRVKDARALQPIDDVRLSVPPDVSVVDYTSFPQAVLPGNKPDLWSPRWSHLLRANRDHELLYPSRDHMARIHGALPELLTQSMDSPCSPAPSGSAPTRWPWIAGLALVGLAGLLWRIR